MTGWEILMSYASPEHLGSQYGSNIKVGEVSSWIALGLSVTAGLRAAAHMLGDIQPSVVQGWVLMVAAAIGGIVSVGTLAYARWIQAKLDGDTREAMTAANIRAINAGATTMPFPMFMPKGYIRLITDDPHTPSTPTPLILPRSSPNSVQSSPESKASEGNRP